MPLAEAERKGVERGEVRWVLVRHIPTRKQIQLLEALYYVTYEYIYPFILPLSLA